MPAPNISRIAAATNCLLPTGVALIGVFLCERAIYLEESARSLLPIKREVMYSCFACCFIGGVMTGELRSRSKWVQCLSMASLSVALLFILFILEARSIARRTQSDIPSVSNILKNRSVLLTLSVSCLGGLLGGLASGIWNFRQRRRKWKYVTRSGDICHIMGPGRAPVQALFWIAMTGIVSLAFFFSLFLLFHPVNSGWKEILELSLIYLACLPLYTYSKFKKHWARSAIETLRQDRRRPILYLRSFQSDGRSLPEPESRWYESLFSKIIVPKPIRYWYSFFSTVIEKYEGTIEQRLASAFNPLGPFIAVGRPGEDFAELGASRLYVGSDWKILMADLLTRCRGVVFEIGVSRSLGWELETVFESLKTHQVVLFCPFRGPKREEKYLLFRQWAGSQVPCQLPETIGEASFLYFLPNEKGTKWSTRVVDPEWEVSDKHPFHSAIESAFELLSDKKPFRRSRLYRNLKRLIIVLLLIFGVSLLLLVFAVVLFVAILAFQK